MKRLHMFAAATIAAASLLQATAQSVHGPAVMPTPLHMERTTSGPFVFAAGQTVALAGARPERLQRGVLRALKRLEDATGLPMPRAIGPATTGTLTVTVASDGAAVQGVDEDESYKLAASDAGVRIDAATTTGALHALETLIQLVQPAEHTYIVAAVTIQDSPRFRWRGLHIDCSRHFEPLPVLKRNLDAMAAVKLNVFHWHLTDDQGFRMESKRYPKLTALGSDGLFYTQDEARELVRYARDRGIRVVPEFEMPGHSAAWLVAYPELNSGSQPDGIRREFGVSDIALDPTNEQTYTFVQNLLTEMSGIFPDAYVHIGGDETPAPDWKTNPRILAFKQAHGLKDNEALQAYFNTRVLKILTGLHKRMVGWDEIFNPDLPKDIVIQSWRGEASLSEAARQGYQGLLSAPYYLDGMRSAGVHYLADPVPADTKLTPEQQALVLGGEICMWAEHLNERTLDSRIWPRAAAIAERFWSAQNVRDVPDMYRRLDVVSVELESVGLRHLSSEDAGLRSLADSSDIRDLRTFAGAFEPVSFGERYQQQHTSQLTPLTGFVDAVVPDPPQKHRLDEAVTTLLQHAGTPEAAAAAAMLQSYFDATRQSVVPVQQQMQHAPRLQAVAVRADQLGSLCDMALQALAYVQSGKTAPATWKSHAAALLQQAKQPTGLVRFVFQDSLTRLVEGVR